MTIAAQLRSRLAAGNKYKLRASIDNKSVSAEVLIVGRTPFCLKIVNGTGWVPKRTLELWVKTSVFANLKFESFAFNGMWPLCTGLA